MMVMVNAKVKKKTISTRTDLLTKTHRFKKNTRAKQPKAPTKVYIKYRALFNAVFVSDLISALTFTAPPMVLSSAVAVPGMCVGTMILFSIDMVGLRVGDNESFIVPLGFAIVEVTVFVGVVAVVPPFVGTVVGTGDFVTTSSGTEGATNLLVGCRVGCCVFFSSKFRDILLFSATDEGTSVVTSFFVRGTLLLSIQPKRKQKSKSCKRTWLLQIIIFLLWGLYFACTYKQNQWTGVSWTRPWRKSSRGVSAALFFWQKSKG